MYIEFGHEHLFLDNSRKAIKKKKFKKLKKLKE